MVEKINLLMLVCGELLEVIHGAVYSPLCGDRVETAAAMSGGIP
jgi:hypothetical protein